MNLIDATRIDLAIHLERLSIEEQLSRMRFAETRAELDAHRRLEADLTRALTILGVSCGDYPIPAVQPATLTAGRVSDLPASAAGECETRKLSAVTPTAGNSFASGGVERHAEKGRDSTCTPAACVRASMPREEGGNSLADWNQPARNPNSDVKQVFPRGRW